MTWSHKMRLGEVPHTGVTLELSPNEAERTAIARELDIVALERLAARVRLTPWLDGVQLDGEWSADIVQTCGVTLERLDEPLSGNFLVRIVPAGSPNAPSDDDVDFDMEADDPPDVSEDDSFDLAAYMVEHLALEIDPFPRKPGVEFVQPPEPAELSPFAALKGLKTKPD